MGKAPKLQGRVQGALVQYIVEIECLFWDTDHEHTVSVTTVSVS
jgi:hypothetical protein